MVKWFDSLSTTVRIVLLIPIWGWVFSGLYRIFKYVEGENKNVATLVVGILCFFCIGFIFSLIDLITTIMNNKISILAD